MAVKTTVSLREAILLDPVAASAFVELMIDDCKEEFFVFDGILHYKNDYFTCAFINGEWEDCDDRYYEDPC